MINIPESVQQEYNKVIYDLYHHLQPLEISYERQKKLDTSLDVSHSIKSSDIVNLPIMISRAADNTIYQIYFYAARDKPIGFSGDSCEKILVLVEKLAEEKGIKDIVSHSTIIDVMLKWFRTQKLVDLLYIKDETILDFFPHFVKELNTIIHDYTIWIPIPKVKVEKEFKIGEIKFVPITENNIKNWSSVYPMKPDEDQEYVDNLFDDIKRKYLGQAAAQLTVQCEPQMAEAIAFEKIELSISLLRLFSTEAFVPHAATICSPLGKEYIRTRRGTFTDAPENAFKYVIIEQDIDSWFLDRAFIDKIDKEALHDLTDMLDETKKTQFKDKLLNSLIIYSKGTVQKTIEEKLTFFFLALELLLEKSPNEPLEKNVSERFAYVLMRKLDSRKDVMNNYHECFKLRNSFLYPAQTHKNSEVLVEFLKNLNTFFIKMIQLHNEFQTTREFFQELELKITESPNRKCPKL